MDKKYCPACGQDVPLERTLQGNYLLIGCKLCGLGLGVKLASADELRRFQAQEGNSLGRVEVVRRSMQHEPSPLPPSVEVAPKP